MKIANIFIMLGHECNLNCKYCIQHNMVNEQLSHEIDTNVFDYIHKIISNQKEKSKLTFFGGEPLIFFEDIKKYVNEFKRKIRYNIITNGKLLNEEYVNYFNKNLFSVGISYDGDNSDITRGYNVLKEKEDLLLKIRGLCLTGVITKYNYPKNWFDSIKEFNKKYIQKHKRHVTTNLDLLLNNNNLNDLSNIDSNLLYNQMKELCNHYIDVQDEKTNVEASDLYIDSLIERDLHEYDYRFPKCMNGMNIINVTNDGKLYLCHNSDIVLGNVKDNNYLIIKKVLDFYKKHKKEQCINCDVNVYCRGGCMLQSTETMNNYFCNVSKHFFMPIKELREIFID